MSPRGARLAAAAAAILFSTGGAAIKLTPFNGTQVASLRSGVAAAVLWMVLRRRLTWSPDVLAAAAVYAATLTLFVNATKLTVGANAVFLQAAAPLYLLLLAPLLLRERVGIRDGWFVAAVSAGLVCCFAGRPADGATAPNPPLGNLLGLVSGVTWALTLLALRRAGRDDPSGGVAISVVIIGNALASLAGLPFALPLPRVSPSAWLPIVYLGAFQIGLAYICLTAAARQLPALDLSLLLVIEPVLNPVWTWLIQGEQPGPWVIAGGALIIGANALKLAADARTLERATP